MANESRIVLTSCPVQNVTVFVDRAQVTRHCVLRPSAVGEHVLIITGLTSSAEKESLRLKVMGDQEDDEKKSMRATIDEVSVGSHLGAENDSREPVRKALREKIKALDIKEKALLNEGARLREQAESLRGYLKGMLCPSNNKGKADPPVGNNLEAVTQLLAYHAAKTDEMDARQAEIPHLLNELRIEKDTVTAELSQISRSELVVSHTIKAVLTITHPSELVLSVQYIVKNAQWKPAYDLRYESKQGVPSNLEVTYNGVVTQTTGEDWNDTTISLSTAAPARGGAPPMPPTRIASLYYAGGRAGGHSAQPSVYTQAAMHVRRTSVSAGEIAMDDPPTPPNGPSENKVKDGVSATYIIDRKCSISSDPNDHKVTIGMVPLDTEVRFFVTPQLEQQAYIQTRAVNTSMYTFLESDKASVFIDGSFIAKTKFQLTSPGENINLFLGVDPAIKVEHRTLKDTTTKGKEGKMLAKKEPSKRVVDYRTIVYNTKATAVEVMVVELLPRANDERIVVDVLQPANLMIGEGELKIGGAMQNKLTNNVVFFRKLNAGEKLELPFSYSITWPHDAGNVDVYDPPSTPNSFP